MSYARRILHYSSDPTIFQSLISDRAVAGCSFELNRLGGCGAGELQLNDEFANRDSIQVGDWIAFEYSAGVRWYMGRVEYRSATVPAGVSFRLEGMSVQLGELFAGGFNSAAGQGLSPQLYAQNDLFLNDPDYAAQVMNTVSEPRELVILLMQQYVVPKSNILLDTTLIDTLTNPSLVSSMKFRGEESIKDVIKDLALRAGHASWGVQPDGRFFYLQKPTATTATWRVGRDIISLEETRERNQLYNRLLLTGGYIYDAPAVPGNEARSIYRWRGNYTQPASRTAFGERRIRMNIPWIRTAADSREFAREFFRVYAEPTTHYILDVGDQAVLPFPWEGQIKIEDESGGEIVTSAVETVRVQFDHAPRFQIEIGPDDPQIHWDEPPFNERWEIPSPAAGNPRSFGGEEISLTSFIITDPPDPTSSSVIPPSSSYIISSSSPVSSSPPASGSSSVLNSSSSAALPPCNLAHDTFTDTNGVLLTAHTMDTGSGWVVSSGLSSSWTIQNNKAEGTGGNGGLIATETNKADVKVSVDVTLASPTASRPQLLFRHSGLPNHWFVQIDPVLNTLELFKRISSSNTKLETYDMGTVSAGDSYNIQVRCDGNVIMVDLDGVERLTYDSAELNTNTECGLGSFNSGSSTFDNFCVEDYTDTTQPTVTLTTPASTVSGAFTVTATFSKNVTGFSLGDISVTNGTASVLAGSGKDYTFTVTPTAEGVVTTSVAAGVATDSNSNTNAASNSLVTTYDTLLAHDTFTEASGNISLIAHTPDIDVVGGGWNNPNKSGTLRIFPDTNFLQPFAAGNGRHSGSLDVGESAIDISVDVTIGSETYSEAGVILRALTNSGMTVILDKFKQTFEITELPTSGAAAVTRASKAFVVNAGDEFVVRATIDSSGTIRGYVDGTLQITYTTSYNATSTYFGVYSKTVNFLDNMTIKKLA